MVASPYPRVIRITNEFQSTTLFHGMFLVSENTLEIKIYRFS